MSLPLPAPQSTSACKSHRVEMLRARPIAPRIAVGKAEDAAIGVDDAGLAARITRQARVTGRMDVAGDDRLAGRKARDDALRRHPGRCPALDRRPDLRRGQSRVESFWAQCRPARRAGPRSRNTPGTRAHNSSPSNRRPEAGSRPPAGNDRRSSARRRRFRRKGRTSAAPTRRENTGSFASRSIGPNPSMPPMSWMAFTGGPCRSCRRASPARRARLRSCRWRSAGCIGSTM